MDMNGLRTLNPAERAEPELFSFVILVSVIFKALQRFTEIHIRT